MALLNKITSIFSTMVTKAVRIFQISNTETPSRTYLKKSSLVTINLLNGNLNNTNLIHPGENDMNMNLDNEQDFRELNTLVKNYFTVEFVAIPSDFDISSYLSLRESAGIFGDFKEVNLSQVKMIMMGIQNSPVFAVLNNTMLSPSSCMYVLSVLNDLGLVIKSIHNPIRKDRDDYKEFLKRFERNNGQFTYIRGQEMERINFVIINVCLMMSDEIIGEAMEIAIKTQKYQKELDSKLEKIQGR